MSSLAMKSPDLVFSHMEANWWSQNLALERDSAIIFSVLYAGVTQLAEW